MAGGLGWIGPALRPAPRCEDVNSTGNIGGCGFATAVLVVRACVNKSMRLSLLETTS